MSAYGEQIRSWLDPSLQVLKDDHRADPERELRQRAAEMWDRLGVTAGTDDPVAAALVTLFGELLDRVDSAMSGEEQVSYFAGDTFEREVVELIELAVAQHEADVEPAEPEDTEAEAMASAEMVTGQVVQDLAIPVLRELARTRPDLVARHSTDELIAQVGQVIVQRLLAD